jgi:CheY-like chemotaxis protein
MLKILLIDDEEEVLNTIARILLTVGHNVVKARNGKEGISRFDEQPFDLVITDLFMPLANGDEVARYVSTSGKRVPVIGITGTPKDMDRTSFDKVLEKPFMFEDLIESIKAFYPLDAAR